MRILQPPQNLIAGHTIGRCLKLQVLRFVISEADTEDTYLSYHLTDDPYWKLC